MNKKIICIGIITLFFLTNINSQSVLGSSKNSPIKNTNNNDGSISGKITMNLPLKSKINKWPVNIVTKIGHLRLKFNSTVIFYPYNEEKSYSKEFNQYPVEIKPGQEKIILSYKLEDLPETNGYVEIQIIFECEFERENVYNWVCDAKHPDKNRYEYFNKVKIENVYVTPEAEVNYEFRKDNNYIADVIKIVKKGEDIYNTINELKTEIIEEELQVNYICICVLEGISEKMHIEFLPEELSESFKSIIIYGEKGAKKTIINPSIGSNDDKAVVLEGNNIRLEGFTIKHDSIDNQHETGIVIGSKNIYITNNEITNNCFGILDYSGVNIIIENNKFVDNKYAISAENEGEIRLDIINNVIENNDIRYVGIHLKTSEGVISNRLPKVYIKINENKFSNCIDAIYLEFYQAVFYERREIEINDNEIKDSDSAINYYVVNSDITYVESSFDIKRNKISNTKSGISIECFGYGNIIGNDFSEIEQDVLILKRIFKEVNIWYNNFYSTDIEDYSINSVWQNNETKKGNFWIDYEAKVKNARKNHLLGTWYKPYPINSPRNFQDYYPLIDPCEKTKPKQKINLAIDTMYYMILKNIEKFPLFQRILNL